MDVLLVVGLFVRVVWNVIGDVKGVVKEIVGDILIFWFWCCIFFYVKGVGVFVYDC